MEEHAGRLADAALDVKIVIDELDSIRRGLGHPESIKLGRTMLKLREAFGDLIGLIPAPHSLPPHQSR